MNRIFGSKRRPVLTLVLFLLLVFALSFTQLQVLAQDNPIDGSQPTTIVTKEPSTTPSVSPTVTAQPNQGIAAAPVPTAPTGTISDTTPSFKWKRVSGATQYNFVLYKGSKTIYSKTVANSTCGSNTTYCVNTPTTVLADGTYTWKVRAYISGGWQSFSTLLTFKLISIPSPSAPTGTISDTTPTFTWSRIVNATQYSYTLYKGSTTVYTKTVPTASCGTSTTTCSNTPSTILADATYTWKVRAYVGGTWQIYSPIITFKLISIPTISLPTGTISDSTPQYKWSRILNATQYSFTLLKGSSTVYTKTVPVSSCTSTVCTNTPTTVLSDGSYKWRVRAYVGGAWQLYSAYTSFTLKTIPTPLSPSGLISNRQPTFTWTPIVNATQYRYFITYNGSTKSLTVPASACTVSKCSASQNEDIPLGAYSWHVQAYLSGTWKSNSSEVSFIINTNPYTGSGLLDGNGIPSDFFSDVHIRKAFSYCMDWDKFITDNYGGGAIQSLELSMPGMIGYDPDAPHYTYDLTKAAAEFKLADLDHDGIAAGEETDGTDIWSKGFFTNMPYNSGNTTRKEIAEILAEDLKAVNVKFNLEPVALDWPTYSAAQNAYQVPIMSAGWLEDIHDPHNWFQPYTVGVYAQRQNMPDDLKSEFQTLVNDGATEADPAARADIYSQLNQLYFDDVPGIPVILTNSNIFEQRSVTGRILNPLFPGVYLYPISKTGGTDTTTFVDATIGDINTLDPALAYDTASGNVIQNIYETLVFYKGDSTDEFVPQLATEVPTMDNGGISEDGKTITFHIRTGVYFQNGSLLTPSDVAYSFQRGLLQGGSASPQWLLTEAFFGTGIYDITDLIDSSGALRDDRAALQEVDSTTLLATCQHVKDAIVVDNGAGTVTFHLAQAWGPMMPTLAQTWGSILNQYWVKDHGGWNGNCSTWQNYYAMNSSDDPLSSIAMGTGPFALDHRTAGTEIELTANTDYWRTDPAYSGGPSGAPALSTAWIKIIPNWDDRLSMLSSGDADVADILVDGVAAAKTLAGETCAWNKETNSYDTCEVVDDSQPLRLYYGQPNNISQDVVIYNFNIQ